MTRGGQTRAGRQPAAGSLFAEEVQQEGVDPLRRLPLYPVAGPVDPLVTPGAETKAAEPVICCSVRAKSPELHTPMVGTVTGGNWSGGSTRTRAWTLAR